MDKSALKDKRRETVIGLLKGMSIRKDTDGGFEKDDVYGCIQELCNLYEDHITELESNYEAEISELTKRYQKYDENNELYVSLILEAKKSSNEIINQAKTEVDEILKNGKEKIRVQEEQLEQFRADSEKERESIAEELKASKEVAEAEKAAMKVEMEAEKEKLEATKNKYRQQITAMEDEFAEIKTNILRTSARLDSLKAQTEELSPSIDWEVEETDIEVEVPDADVEVEEFAEAEAVIPAEEEPAEEAPEEEAPAAAVPVIDESELPEAVKSIELVLDEQFEEPVEAQVEVDARVLERAHAVVGVAVADDDVAVGLHGASEQLGVQGVAVSALDGVLSPIARVVERRVVALLLPRARLVERLARPRRDREPSQEERRADRQHEQHDGDDRRRHRSSLQGLLYIARRHVALDDQHRLLPEEHAEVAGDLLDRIAVDIEEGERQRPLLGEVAVLVEVPALDHREREGHVIAEADLLQDGGVLLRLEALLQGEGIVQSYVDLRLSHGSRFLEWGRLLHSTPPAGPRRPAG